MKQFGQLDSAKLKSLNRRLLVSQYLSRKASGPSSVVTVARACCGINSQDLLESFSSFWARVEGFNDSMLTSELRPKGGLVRTWTVRNTMHIIPVDDYLVHVLGGPGRRFRPRFDKVAKERGIPQRDFRVNALYQPFLEHIEGRAVTTNEAKEFMVDRLRQLGLKATMKLARGWSSKPTYGPSWSGLSEMCNLGLLVTAGRHGSESLWMRASDWLNVGREDPDEEECVTELVRKYIENYGPVSHDDIVYWSYLLKADVDMALEALKDELVKGSFDSGLEYFSLGEESHDIDPPMATILPEFDSLMMGYKDKSRFLSHNKIKKVFWGLGGINRTILLDGFVAATWKRTTGPRGMSVRVRPLRALVAREKRSIEEGFEDYADYRGTRISTSFDG